MWNDEIGMLGLDSTQNYHSLNLAGGDAWPPDARELARANYPMTPAIEPDYELPDMEIPAIKPYDLSFPKLDVYHGAKDVDPALPDLQHAELTPQVQMPADERPGDLAPQAVDMLHADAHFQQTSDKAYPYSQMDARGMNDTRARHMALLTDGLGK